MVMKKTNQQVFEEWREKIYLPLSEKYLNGLKNKDNFSTESIMKFNAFEEKFLVQQELFQSLFEVIVNHDHLLKAVDELKALTDDIPKDYIPEFLREKIQETHGKRLLFKPGH